MTPTSDLQTALLLGEDHAELEDVAIRELVPNLAIGISRGRFLKGYPYVDPNEDAVFAAAGGDIKIIAVADGHSGFDAARAAITAIADAATSLAEETPEIIVRNLAVTAIEAVAATVPTLPAPRCSSCTALTIVGIRDDTLATATIGDTACYVVTRRRAARLGEPTSFLDADTDPAATRIHSASLPVRGAVIVASDGLVDYAIGLDRTLRATALLDAPDAVEHLIEASFAGGAGDNVAVVVHRRS